MAKKLTPITAKTHEDVCKLSHDNVVVGDYTIAIGEDYVSLWNTDESVNMSRDVFDKFVTWYTLGVVPAEDDRQEKE